MLVALLAAYFSFMAVLGSGDGQFGQLMDRHVEGRIEAVIQDDDRRKAAVKGLDRINAGLNDFNRQLSGDLKNMETLIRDYKSTPGDFDRLFADSLANRQQIEDRLWDDRKAMLKHIEPHEWQAIMQGAMAEQENEKEDMKN